MAMKIKYVRIKKFRSIKDAVFRMGDISAIVGENNAGKTAILRAINSFFNFECEENSFTSKAHLHTKRSNSYVTITFEDIPVNSSELVQYLDGDELSVEFMYSYNDNRRRIAIVKEGKKHNIVNADFLINELKQYINYVYIPSERTNYDISWGEDTIFRKLVTAYLDQHTRLRDTISPQIKRSSKTITDGVLTRLEKKISKLYLQNVDVNFNLSLPSNIDYSSILHLVEMSINESDSNYLLQEWGSGTKSLAIIAMHRSLALIQNKNIVLGIEEPETNLHPQAQKKFIQSLKTGMDDNEVQTVFTTHSTVLIDELEHEDIILVKRKKDKNRNFISTVNQISIDFFARNGIDVSGHKNFFKIKNSEFFFAQYVIICESPIDAYVIETLIKSEIQTYIADVAFVDLGGVKNLHYPYFLMRELSIPFSVVVDFDFFFDYKNDELNKSRKQNGLPEYKTEITNSYPNRMVINDAFQNDIASLEVPSGYRDFFKEIKKQRFYSMMYCMEIDFTRSKAACEIYYDILNVDISNRNRTYLLKNCFKALKKRENIIKVISALEKQYYPESLLKIKNAIIEDVNSL